jgi:cation diffusion facilitator family transporter
MSTATIIDEATTVREARRITWVGFAVNALLGAMKIVAGIFGRSAAMVADGVHSLTDFVTDAIVIVCVGIAHRKANSHYQYGHGKYETLATMLLAMILVIVAIAFFIDGLSKTLDAINGVELPRPRMIALAMAVASILSKEWLFRATRSVGRRINSAVVIANAWHHRSDALSSIATLIGVGGAMALGQRWTILDPIAAMVVSIFILLVAVKLGMPAVRELLEESLPDAMVNDIAGVIASTDGVKAFHHMRTRRNGNLIILDFHIKVDPTITRVEAHDIAEAVEYRLRQQLNDQMIANIHVEPYRGEPTDNSRRCTD